MDSFLQIGLSNAVAALALALLAVAAGAVCRRPALAHGLWLLVLLKLLTPPLVRVPVPWPVAAPAEAPAPAPVEVVSEPALPQPDEAPAPAALPAARAAAPPAAEGPAEAAALPAEGAEALSACDERTAAAPPAEWPWSEALSAVWLTGSLAWFALAGLRLARFARLLRHATPAPAALQKRAEQLARRLGLTRCPGVWLLPGRVAPMLWAAFGAPRLLVPSGLLGRLTPEGRDTLLLHELAHLRRGDHRVRALEFLAMGLYWWHPVVWFARRELREAEEQCCDAWVVSALPGAGRAYASALLDTLDFLSAAPPAVPLLASGLGQVSDLKRRLTMIMRGTTPRALGWRGAFVVLALGALLLPVLPTRAQDRPGREDDKEETAKRVRVLRGEEDPSPQLQKAEAELRRLEVEIKRKAAEIAAAKAKLKAEAARAKSAAVARARREVVQRVQVGQRQQGGPQVRIEIIVSGDEKYESVRNLLKKLQEVLPDGNRRVIYLRTGGAAGVGTGGGSGMGVGAGIRFTAPAPPRPGAAPEAPRPPVPPPPGLPGAGAMAGLPGMMAPGLPGRRGNDPRIEGLEKKLEAIMREVEALRRDLNRQRRGGGSGGGGGAGDAPRRRAPDAVPMAGLPPLPPGTLPPDALPSGGTPPARR